MSRVVWFLLEELNLGRILGFCAELLELLPIQDHDELSYQNSFLVSRLALSRLHDINPDEIKSLQVC